MKYSISGRLAEKFQANPITPLIAITAVLLGLFAVLVTPKEEEPQIDVTFANVYIALPGASAKEVENLIAYPAEQVIDSIEDIKHVYSISRPGLAIISAQFKVGIKRKDAIVNLYNEIHSNADWLPRELGASQPLIKPMGIDDVPIVTATLWSDNLDKGSFELQQVAYALETEIKRIPNTRIVKTTGGPKRVVHILLSPEKMSAYGLDFTSIERALKASNFVTHSGQLTNENTTLPVETGTLLANIDDVKSVVVSVKNGIPIYLTDIALIQDGADSPDTYVWINAGQAWSGENKPQFAPAVTIAIGKKAGTNAADIANAIVDITKKLRATHIPNDVHLEITRNYGKTADDKAKKLMTKLMFATGSVVLLIMFFLGWKEALVVGLAVSITLAITLFASWAYGFTLNRVSLFALIFSIGILVDDAVVIVENIHRHLSEGNKKLSEVIPLAVDEVGGPTILATFTVIAALMPMAFVTGLMGPYMSPIPINASMGMMLSLLIALIVTPWLFRKVIGNKIHVQITKKDKSQTRLSEKQNAFAPIMQPFLIKGSVGKRNRYLLVFGVIFLMISSVILVPTQKVILKMLPFDNKSELQIVIDTEEGTSLEKTNQIMLEIAHYLNGIPEITHTVAYAGTASPINFNGLVRQYFLRQGANVGDIQISLLDKNLRERQSHEIAIAIRENITRIAQSHSAIAKIVEVPPGPPVQSPILAEIYGPSDNARQDMAKRIESIFQRTKGIVDIDTSVEKNSPRMVIEVNKTKAALLGVDQVQIAKAIKTGLEGSDVSYLHNPNNKYSVPIRLEVPPAIQNDLQVLLSIPLVNKEGQSIILGEVVNVKYEKWQQAIYHKDLLPVTFVSADMSGYQDSPLYGMFELVEKIDAMNLNSTNEIVNQTSQIEQNFISTPQFSFKPSIKWDGEWQITYETFRDMGLAYGVGLILIYLLIVAQFGSYFVPLIIMAPIPLTIIGVMPGHWLAGSQFTATSMIGMIALAGIIVRNSILLVDFINIQVAKGVELSVAVVDSARVRAKPIILTGVAAMMGAFFILDDPIFNGLAISLISGILVSTMLTLILIPVLYFWYLSRFGSKQ